MINHVIMLVTIPVQYVNQYQMNNPQFIMHQQQIMAQKQMIQQQFIQQMQQDQSMQQQQINLFFEIHGERTVI